MYFTQEILKVKTKDVLQMENVKHLVEELKVAAGEAVADLLLQNIQLVDVYTDKIYPASLLIFHGKIVAINPNPKVKVKKTLDGMGYYAVPGFMDSHVHIETTLLTPEALAAAIVPWGTTTMFVDAMEIANVSGIEGLLALIKDAEKLPFRIYLEVPSRVPTAPGLETSGAVLGVPEVKRLLELPETVSLGELDPSKILGYREEYLEKIIATLAAGKICNGHAIGLTAEQLNIYATAHLADDHESVTFKELEERMRVGIKALVREGSSERNVDALMLGVIEHDFPTTNLLFCTDDKHVNDIQKEGHISYNVQRSIDLGLNPIKAIQIATLNAAKHFHLDHLLGSLTPGRYADIVLLKDLYSIKPEIVLKDGKIVAKDGKAVPVTFKSYPEYLFHTVKIDPNFTHKAFDVTTDGSSVKVRVIELCPNQIINREKTAWLKVTAGKVQPDLSQDILKLAVVERHGKNGRTGVAFVQGFELQTGALASSVSHDHHNIVVVGTNDEDMALAVQALVATQGGFAAVKDGKIIDQLALPLAGLMSVLPAAEVMVAMDRLNNAVLSLGCKLPSPFMALSFISLPTVPELGLTDYGLIDVLKHQIIEVILERES